jgi:uncharacterized RDD family membrane protein YckC
MPVFPAVLNDPAWQQFKDHYIAFAKEVSPCLFLLPLLYDVLFNGTFGATLGKMAVGAKIIGVDGSPLGYSRALLRSLAVRFTILVGFLWILARSDKRGLHDLLAGTRVVFQR